MSPRVLRFKGEITALSPISYSIPELDKLPRLSGLPYLTASGLRGNVRRAATAVAVELWGQTPTIDDYFLLTLGGIKDAKKESEKSGAGKDGEGKAEATETSIAPLLRTRFAREHNPVVRLFGSMTHGVPGGLYCDHAIAKTPGEFVASEAGRQFERHDAYCDVVRFVRADDLQRIPDGFEWISQDSLDSYLSRKAGAKERSKLAEEEKRVQKELREAKRNKADPQALEDIQGQLRALEAQKKQTHRVSIALPNLGYECIRRGTTFAHEWTLQAPSEAEIDLFLLWFYRYEERPYFGGRRFHGLGRINAFYEVEARLPGERAWKTLGSVAFDGEGTLLKTEGDIGAYLEAKALKAMAGSGALDLSEAGIRAAAAQAETVEDEAA